jgi:hypothetical protein
MKTIQLIICFLIFSIVGSYNVSAASYSREEFAHKASEKDIKDCLKNDELRWAVICEYNGWLTSHYSTNSYGGSTGMVKINGKNCTPHGSGTAGATFVGADGKTYSFAHSRHRSHPRASELFHNAQYYLFFTKNGQKFLKKYKEEIKILKKLNADDEDDESEDDESNYLYFN